MRTEWFSLVCDFSVALLPLHNHLCLVSLVISLSVIGTVLGLGDPPSTGWQGTSEITVHSEPVLESSLP